MIILNKKINLISMKSIFNKLKTLILNRDSNRNSSLNKTKLLGKKVLELNQKSEEYIKSYKKAQEEWKEKWNKHD